MNIAFAQPHVRTLRKLMDMADKRDCLIVFGFDSSSSGDLDSKLIEEIDGKEFCEKLSGLYPEEIQTVSSSVWFELIRRNAAGGFILSLKYQEKSTFFKLDQEHLDELEEEGIKTDDLSGVCDWDQCYFIYEDKTTILRRESDEPIKDHTVYRPEMALKYFADAVCNYFHEPLIDETY